MRKLITTQRNIASDAFNDEVARLYQDVSPCVRQRVKKVGRHRIQRPNGDDLGDIDVLVALPGRRKLIAVETKDLAIARTPVELRQELEDVFESPNNQSTDVGKHRERTTWIRGHRAEVLQYFELESHDARRWTVEPLIVVNLESLTSHLMPQRIRVVSIQELKRELAQQS